MAKKNETTGNGDNKKNANPKKTKKGVRTPVTKIPVMDEHVHPHYRGMDE